VTVKGKMDTNGYPFEEDKHSLSIRYPFERLLKKLFETIDQPFEWFAYSFQKISIRLNGFVAVQTKLASIWTVCYPFEKI